MAMHQLRHSADDNLSQLSVKRALYYVGHYQGSFQQTPANLTLPEKFFSSWQKTHKQSPEKTRESTQIFMPSVCMQEALGSLLNICTTPLLPHFWFIFTFFFFQTVFKPCFHSIYCEAVRKTAEQNLPDTSLKQHKHVDI